MTNTPRDSTNHEHRTSSLHILTTQTNLILGRDDAHNALAMTQELLSTEVRVYREITAMSQPSMTHSKDIIVAASKRRIQAAEILVQLALAATGWTSPYLDPHIARTTITALRPQADRSIASPASSPTPAPTPTPPEEPVLS